MQKSAPTLAVVIPHYRDEAALQELLQHLQPLRSQIDEIIVVDGSSSSACQQLCQQYACDYLASSACRGSQMDMGAKQTAAAVIWFLHADAKPHAEAVQQIKTSIQAGVIGGCFAFAFDVKTPSWWLGAFARITNWRAKLGVPYGDQGLFARSDAYQLAGGFQHQPLFEEVSLVKALRRNGRFVHLDMPLPVSTRRWQRDGWWRRSLMNRCLALAYMLGIPPAKLAKMYTGRVTAQCVTNKLNADQIRHENGS